MSLTFPSTLFLPQTPRQPLIYFQSIICPLLIVSETIEYVVLCDWHLAFNIMLSRFIQVVACISTQFLFIAE